MPRATLPPTPGSSTDMKGKDGSKLASLQMTFELPPPAMLSSDASNTSSSPLGAQGSTPYPMQPSETVKSRRRSSAVQGSSKDKDQFALPPPPTRSRKIIQMKPREESPQEVRSNSKASSSAASSSKSNTSAAPPPAVAGTKRKQPSSTSAAGRKIARKTAHSLIERRRRSKMNEEFAVLKGMIPACTGEMHKLAILQASIEYVRYLEECITKLKAQCDPDAQSRTTETGLPSPTSREPYNPDRNYSSIMDAGSPDVEMTSSDMPSPAFTHSAGRSQQPSISPALLPEDSRDRHNSYSSVSTEYRQHRYSVSSTTSPTFGSLPHGYPQSIHSGPGSTFTSPALLPQRDLDQEATAALLMLNQADRRHPSTASSGSGTTGRGMSVRDLLST